METTTPATGKSTTTVKPYRILALDGGGAKGFYTLGILREIEGINKKILSDSFDLIYGTSTGAIIAALLARGSSVDEITDLYRKYVPQIMKEEDQALKTTALRTLADTVFGTDDFSSFKTDVGIVTTNWLTEKPTIFKSNMRLTHGRKGTAIPGFGCTIAEAVVASCSAYPFFERQMVATKMGKTFELADGGFCANNPALYALTDATGPRGLNLKLDDIRLVSLGVGKYPPKALPLWDKQKLIEKFPPVILLQKLLEVNTCSMEQLTDLLYAGVPTVRINKSFNDPSMATDFLEHDLKKLNALYVHGSESFAPFEEQLRSFL